MQRDLFEAEHDMFRDSFRRFLEKEIVPRTEEFERAGIMDRAIFARAGAAGFLAMEAPEEYGGGGVKDFRYNTVIIEEIAETAIGGSGSGSRSTTTSACPTSSTWPAKSRSGAGFRASAPASSSRPSP